MGKAEASGTLQVHGKTHTHTIHMHRKYFDKILRNFQLEFRFRFRIQLHNAGLIFFTLFAQMGSFRHYACFYLTVFHSDEFNLAASVEAEC